MAQVVRLRPRAERTRAAILREAELLFAERGFDGTRLEDVAERVGIRRASIVYYFKDKAAVYGAVLEDVLGGLYERVSRDLSGEGPLIARVEGAVSSWVDYVGERPTLARLLLREVAGALPERPPQILPAIAPFFDLIRREVFEREKLPRGGPPALDPAHVASQVAGSTIFLVAALPALVPGLGRETSSPEHLDAHRDELLRLVRRLLGAGASARAEGRDESSSHIGGVEGERSPRLEGPDRR